MSTAIPAGLGYSTILPDMDFETYSEAGYEWKDGTQKWGRLEGATKTGLSAVGAAVYAEHPSTEVLCLYYDLKDGLGQRGWVPGLPAPQDLFDHLAKGGLIEAWNVAFEAHIWREVCVKRYGWPELPALQLRDAMAKSRAFAFPGALGKAAEVANADVQKDKEGQRLIKKLCCPRNPTKNDKRRRIRPEEDFEDAAKLYQYCGTDISTEASVSAMLPDLSPQELTFWQHTFAMNTRGVGVDVETVDACIEILEQAYGKYNAELSTLTGGAVTAASQVAKLKDWCASRGVYMAATDDEAVTNTLKQPIAPDVRRALEIRKLVGSAGVKKVYAMKCQTTKRRRLCDLFIYHGARTGRDTGAAVQPQNLVKAGPALFWCNSCGTPYGQHRSACHHCGETSDTAKPAGWSWEATEEAVRVLKSGVLEHVEDVFGDAVLTISGCVRGMFVAGEGKDLICSDFSSIEAVVTAMLAGEQWRIDAFHRKEDIYLVSAGRITGKTLADYDAYKAEHGQRHPDRQKIGKPAELGLGFGGWLGAWRQFDSSDNFSDDEVKKNIVAWRDASPAIVEFWGGQCRGKPWAPDSFELYGLEGMAIAAVQNPGYWYAHGMISYGVHNDVLYCRLPSGRYLTYHKPRLTLAERWENQLSITFEGYNSNPTMGKIGWIRINTYGGRLAENVIQATARDIMAHSVDLLERAGYPCVLRVHDEVVAEVPKGWGSVEEFEAIMATMPEWAEGWPVRASGGWRGLRYRKD